MRRASTVLLSSLAKLCYSDAPRRLLSHRPPPPFNLSISSPKSPSRSLETLSDAVLPSRRRLPSAAAAVSDLEEAFESATTTADILSTFSALESSLDPRDHRLGLACLKVGQHLDDAGSGDHHRILELALRALKALDAGGDPSVAVAMALHLVATASYNLKRFNDSLGYLNRANRILSALDESSSSEEFDLRPVAHGVLLQLANTQTAMGRREEALSNLRKCLELKEAILEPNSKELGVGYRDIAEAYSAVLNFKDALPFCLKALELHRAHLGTNSIEVAQDRRLLGVIYTGLEEHKKALEENELSQKVLKNWGMSSDLMQAEIDSANIQIALGKYDEAITTLKSVAQQTDEGSEERAVVLISTAKALSNQDKAADAKRCLEVSCGILEGKESSSPSLVAEAYTEISALYESMNEFGTAISLLKRSLSLIERLPEDQHLEGNVSNKIGWLLLLTGKVEQAIPYLESAIERMKESFGPKHFGVGYVYNNLGAAYLELDRPQSAAQMFALAKDILDVSLGAHHTDSIEVCQSLANAYNTMGSYALAMEFQQRVIDAWAGHGASAEEELTEATRLLEELKKKAFKPLSDAITEMAESMPCASETDAVKLVEH